MLSPSKAAVRRRELSVKLEDAKRRGDIAEMQRLLGELSMLSRIEFGDRERRGVGEAS